MRSRFDSKLIELREDILRMGSMVESQLRLALQALEELDVDLGRQIVNTDAEVNALRFTIEDKCVELIATQQPAARDLRSIVAVMNMIVDLERMGDQAKGIAKIIPRLQEYPKLVHLPELKRMADIACQMLSQCMTAYAEGKTGLARLVAAQDDEVDSLYTRVFTQIMENMAESKKQKKIQASYDVLRIAQEIERFSDLATNVAERIIYIATGIVQEMNVEPDEASN
jgi:phosphate transport system protein